MGWDNDCICAAPADDFDHERKTTPDRRTVMDVTHEMSPTIGALAKALAAAQSEIRPATFDAVNPHFKSRFASLASVREAIAPLARHGIAVVQMPQSQESGDVGVRTMLVHESGEWLACTCWSRAERPGPQALGSVLTYLRRYSLAAVAAVVADEDDDAESAEVRPTTSRPAPVPAPAPDPQPDRASPREVSDVREALSLVVQGDARDREVAGRRARYVAWAVGREVGKLSDLTSAEAKRVVDRARAGDVPQPEVAA